jgi:PAS domain S-box-containing protein
MEAKGTCMSRSITDLESRFHIAVLAGFLATLSYVAARVGGALMLRPQMVWPLWPGCALLVAVLLLVPRKVWPIFVTTGLAGFVLYDLQTGLPIRSIILLILADTVEILIAALGVSYFVEGGPRLNSLNALSKYLFFAVILAPISAAFVSAFAFGGDYWTSWRINFFTEALALLTLTPAILSWVSVGSTWPQKSRAYYFEAASLIAILVLLGYVTFAASKGSSPVMLYSLVPFLLWSALRFGSMGISTSMVAVAFLSIWGTIHGRGPFNGPEPLNDVFSLQLFLLFAATPFMVLAALVEEHKHAAQALKNSEEKFSKAFRQSPILFTLTSAKDHRYIEVNETFERITGWARHEVIGRTPFEIGLWVDPGQRLELTTQLLKEGTLHGIESGFRMKDGRIRTGLESAELIEIDGEPCVLGVTADITERKFAEEALSGMSRRLIEAHEEERTRIARDLHDDINQRLALLAIDIDRLKRNPPGSADEVDNRMGELSKRTGQIAADVQSISHQLHSSKLEYLGIVAAMRGFCSEFAEQQRVEIDFSYAEIPKNLPQGISLCLFRVSQEALHNAVKHSGVRHFDVQLHGASDAIHLIVHDSGHGFDFEAAMQGRGLGLISMKERLKLVNGELSIDSQPKRGTTVHARVPFTQRSTAIQDAG